MDKLYYVRNIGCDDETMGLARISDEDFPKFKTFVENLNKNSTYGCMPVIEVYRVTEDMIIEVGKNDDSDDWKRLYLDNKIYQMKDEYRWCDGLERVI